MNSRSDNVKIGDNTAAYDNEFVNNIANDLTTLVNTGKPQHKNHSKYKKYKKY